MSLDEAEALREAAVSGQLGLVVHLVEERGVDVNATDDYGYTALIQAADRGHIDVVHYLAAGCGARVNLENKSHDTALMKAAASGHLDVVQYLVENCGARLEPSKQFKPAPLTWAARFGHIDVVQYLVGADTSSGSRKRREKALLTAAQFGHIDVVRLLAGTRSSHVKSKGRAESAALLKASEYGNFDIVKCLVEQFKADVNAKNENGNAPLAMASWRGHIDIVRYLTGKCGVDVNSTNKLKATALMEAAASGHIDVVRYLIACGADVNAQDEDGDTAVRRAADHGYNDIQRILTPLITLPAEQPRGQHGRSRWVTSLRERFRRSTMSLHWPRIRPMCIRDTTAIDTDAVRDYNRPSSCSIPPSEIELIRFFQDGSIGGDFQAKWLDADAVVKLSIPDASHSSFEQEVRMWQQLRHPNVIKMYGECRVSPHLQFFVCEFASRGSLWQHAQSGRMEEPTIWKYLYEAALGLQYLHERGIIHGDLRCSNILIGNDAKAKLANFGLSRSSWSSADSSRVVGSTRWQAPEVAKGEPPTRESDVYSLGMCVLEAITGEIPWSDQDETRAWFRKMGWAPETGNHEGYHPKCPPGKTRQLLWRMCSEDPTKRALLSSLIYELEQLSLKDGSSPDEPEREPLITFDEYEGGELSEGWLKLQTHMDECDDTQYCPIFDELKMACEHLQESSHSFTFLSRFHGLVADFYRIIKMPPEQARILRLSSTRATSNSLYAFQWRVQSLMASLGLRTGETEAHVLSLQQRKEQIELFISEASDTFLLVKDLKSPEDRSAFLRRLKAEMKNSLDQCTPEELEGVKKAYEEIARKLELADSSELTPEWFIPWYELVVDEWDCLGEGGFGSVHRGKWLDSDVVVKRVLLNSSSDDRDASGSLSSLSAALVSSSTRTKAESGTMNKAEARAMFQREVDIWFGFSHPHVVRLFGACHVGNPFFVCEFATNGTLVSYLREHPDELWLKLHEAAVGVQYLHARGVVHGDLKGNNIVIGSDLKAKVTDFGLSSLASVEDKPLISGAWQWIAPECFQDDSQRPTFASDVYSLGMCLVEALRVVEAVKSGQDSRSCMPSRLADRAAVKYHSTRGALPSRPATCEDKAWELVTRMCALEPENRIKISTVVDELMRLANRHYTSEESQAIDALLSNSVVWESVPEVIAAGQQLLVGLQTDTTQSEAVLSLYVSLRNRLGQIYERINKKQDELCRASFCLLMIAANEATVDLRDRDDSLISVAVVTMQCYALDRALTKFCEAHFLACHSE